MYIMRRAEELLLASWFLVFASLGITFNGWRYVSAESLFAAFSRPSSPVIVIPFEYIRGHIYLRLNLDGAGLSTIMLDTGFITNQKMIMLDSTVAGRLRLGKGEKIDVSGMKMDDIRARKIDDVDIRLDENAMVRSPAEAVNLAGLRSALDQPVDGIIGFAFLRDYVAEIDYTHNTLLLYAPAHYRYRGHGLRLHMEKRRPVIHAEVVLPDGKKRRTRLLIDTGSDSELLFYRAFIDRYSHSLLGRDLQQTTFFTLDGKYTCDVVRLRNIQFGDDAFSYNLMFNAPYVALARMTTDASARGHLDGGLGNPLLRHANAIFDPRRRRFILEPVPVTVPPKVAVH